MTGGKSTHAARLIAAILIVCGSMSGAMAQSSKAADTQPKLPAPAWHECGAGSNAADPAAIAKAKDLLARAWLRTDRGDFAAYTMPGEKRNPFDLSPKAPDSGPRDGIVQARPPICAWRMDDNNGNMLVRFITPFYRFHEMGHGWSQPLRNGLMLEAALTSAGNTWQARDNSGEHGILLPEQKPRAADANSLPLDAKWAEPIPGCAKRTKWNGETCASRKK